MFWMFTLCLDNSNENFPFLAFFSNPLFNFYIIKIIFKNDHFIMLVPKSIFLFFYSIKTKDWFMLSELQMLEGVNAELGFNYFYCSWLRECYCVPDSFNLICKKLEGGFNVCLFWSKFGLLVSLKIGLFEWYLLFFVLLFSKK